MPIPDIGAFVEKVAAQGVVLYRDFAWRRSSNPYAVLISEVMLQQTQVTRVVPYYERWMDEFPTLDALAGAPLEVVLRAWQGLGYNRRAIALKRLAETLAAQASSESAELPRDESALLALPGIGPATAAGIRAFAFCEPSIYFETNVRTVFLHELFADEDGVHDRDILPLVAQAAGEAARVGIDPRAWNYALLDYGAFLKRVVPNPARRSAHHTKQSTFEGSRRQKRAQVLRAVMDAPGVDADALSTQLGIELQETLSILEDLRAEGFITSADGSWCVE